ncbi:putative FAD-binding domain, FAD/NAD(P)-binding domain superfamily [Septoria linicola]|nr:putative FAD-binding domain, FAD/NAD(P)-binding domain superfamily [Septoria linicola]
MDIIIIGAGLGGLSASVAFARQGHKTTLLEARPTLPKAGGGINIRPGASRIMHTWGLRPDLERIGDHTSTFVLRDMTTGEIATRNIAIDISDEVDYGTTREAVMQILYKRAQEAGATILFGASVDKVEEDQRKARVLLKDGRRLEADLILAADGIRSRVRYQILADVQSAIDPIVSNTTLFGVQIDAEKARSRSDTKRICVTEYAAVWKGQGGFVVSRLNEKLGICTGLFGIQAANDMKGLWDEQGDIRYVRDFFKGSSEDLQAVLSLSKSCDRWKLAELPDLPRWTSKGGRIALLGDSAHAMEPHAAQGFSMIIEDIGVLEYLISRDPDAAKHIPSIMATWQKIRKPRAERIKAYAKHNGFTFLNSAPLPRSNHATIKEKSIRHIKPDMYANFDTAQFLRWSLDYDAVGEAKKEVEGAQANL